MAFLRIIKEAVGRSGAVRSAAIYCSLLAKTVFAPHGAQAQTDAERSALVAIYDATGGDNWTDNANWKSEEPVGNWYGVTVENGVVAKLDLFTNNLTGEIPSEIGNLTNLESLVLDANNVRGAIPAEIGNLTRLEYLGLGANALTGAIPSEIEYLTSLKDLYLTGNALSGAIPSEIGNLTSLERLHLESNALSGAIPAETGNLTRLEGLYLDDNFLSGEIPSETGNLTRLENLRLGNNALTGEIPVEIGNLTRLEVLWLYNNRLSGEIPKETGNLTRLEDVRLGNNALTGEIPKEIGNLARLEDLDLGDNALTGEIPVEIGNLTRLATLGLHNNFLSGAIRSEIENLTGLVTLDLHGNALTGEIPAETGSLTGLEYLDLRDNALSGKIPAETGNLTRLEYLDLGNNALSGKIPAETGNLTRLGWLRLDHNRLSGKIPEEIGGLTNLTVLILNDNTALTGELSAGLRHLPITTLDIRNTCIATPADSDFQAWLAGIEFFDTDRVCTPASVTVTPTALDVQEGGSATYTVVLDAQPSDDVTISLSFAPGSDTDITVDKTSLTFTPQNWDAAQEITVSAAEDDDVSDGEATIEHSASGEGYGDATISSVTATEADNDTEGVTVTPTALAVDEGDSTKYSVALDTQPFANVTISVSFAPGSDEDITVEKTSLTFTPQNWDAAQEITVSAAEDDDVSDGEATIEHSAAGGGYGGVSISSVTATEADNDTEGVTVTPTALDVQEGGSATHTVALDTKPSDDVTISLSFAPGSDEDITVDKTSLTFTPQNWDAAQEITVSAAEDDDAINGTATIELAASGEGYSNVNVPSVTATEADNDTAGVTVTPAALDIPEGDSATYTVALDTQPSDNVTISVSFASDSDEDITVDKTSLAFTTENWDTAQEITVSAAEDPDSEDDAAALNHRASGGDYSEVAIPDVAIRVIDEHSTVDVSDWLARYSRASADHLLSSVRNRMERVGRDVSGTQASVAGRRLAFDNPSAQQNGAFSAFDGASTLWSASQDYMTASPPAGGGYGGSRYGRSGYDGGGNYGIDGYGSGGGHSVRSGNSYGISSNLNAAARRYRNLTLRDALSRSAFRYARQTASGDSFGIWGQGAFSRFGGSEDGADITGNVISGTVGVDHNASGWLRGLAVSRSESEGNYRVAGQENFSLSAAVTGVYPYARYEFTDRLQVWGAGGLGGGSLRLERDSPASPSSTSNLSMALGSVGMSGDIVPAGSKGFGLSWRTDAMLLRSSLDASRSHTAATTVVHRLRLSLKSSWILRMGDRASLAPKVQLGVRRDGGDAEQGMGMDVVGGLGFMHAGWGLRAQVDMHGLVAHEDSDFEEWGVSGMILFDRALSSDLGPSLRLVPSWGSPSSSTGGMRALRSRETVSGLAGFRRADFAGDRSLRLDSRFDYGFAAGDHGVAAPYASVSFSGSEAARGAWAGADADTGANMEIGGGLGYSNESLGLIMRAGMRGLASEAKPGFEAWGASGVVSFDPDPSSPLGASFNVSPSWGVTPRTGFGGMQHTTGAMREPYPGPRSATGPSRNYLYNQPLRVEGEMGYGFSASGGKGVATPYAGGAFSDGGRSGVLVGFNLQAGRRFLLNVEGGAPGNKAISFDTLPEFRVRGLLKW